MLIFICCFHLLVVTTLSQLVEFPLNKFFHGANLENGDFDQLCMFGSNCCNCDENCMKFKTCCADAYWNKTKPVSMETYTKLLVNKSTEHITMVCDNILELKGHVSDSVYMVKSCLPFGNLTDKRKCLESTSTINIPVLGRDSYLYRNEFCAKCNLVPEYTYIDIEMKCGDGPGLRNNQRISMSLLSQFKDCTVSLINNNESKSLIQKCNKSIKTCNNTESKYYDLCLSYTAQINKYKNYHCVLCTNGSDNATVDNPFCLANNTQPDQSRKGAINLHFKLVMNEKKTVVIQIKKQKFPVRQFLSIAGHNAENDALLDFYLCGRGQPNSTCCGCSYDCAENLGCCFDAFWNETNATTMEEYLKTFLAKTKRHGDLSCEYIIESNNFLSAAYTMIKHCAMGADANDTVRCLHSSNLSLEQSVPVIGPDGYMYRNSFCAKCNFVSKFYHINISASCSGLNETEKGRLIKSCILNTETNGVKSDQCTKYLGDDENHSTNDDHDFYKSYKAAFYAFANYGCWKCLQLKNIHEIVQCLPFFGGATGTSKLTWSVILSSSALNHQQSNAQCKNGELYDLKESVCVKHNCPLSYRKTGSECVKEHGLPGKESIDIENEAFDQCLALYGLKAYVSLTNNSIFNVKKFRKDLQNELGINVTFNALLSLSSSAKIMIIIPPAGSNFLNNLNRALGSNKTELWNGIDHYFVTPNTSLSVTELYGFDISRSFSQYRVCAERRVYNAANVKLSSNCDITFDQNTSVPNQNTTMWEVIDKNNNKLFVSVCEKFHLHRTSCPQKVITSNVTILQNKTLTSYSNNKFESYHIEHYTPLEKGYSVCLATSASTKQIFGWHERLTDAEHYISMIVTCVSIFCYVSLLTTYVLFTELRTIPGLSHMSMCVTLLIADGLFFCSVIYRRTYTSCESIAVAIHWSLLSAFMWTAVIAFDLVAKFSSFKVDSNERKLKRFLPRCCFAFAAPTLTVLVTTVLEKISIINVGYGKNGSCWIFNVDARIAWYICPVSFIFLITVAALLLAIYKLNTPHQQNQPVLRNSHKLQAMKISLKFIVILGLTEGIGFMQIAKPRYTESDIAFKAVISLLYTLLRSSRGIMFGYLHIFSQKVVSLGRKKFDHQSKTSVTTNAKV
ncbi:uncharacterized protein LOC130622571 [Hydractinia symbiolongicarpus]|uniref:uncharacterized protein LOC130622571 n=1 Tax=Hydractinia symbiolongicarpus TaxID=13093 RepID=UPI00254D41DD|nr:uncharacterized protein LOC130622571 [Hydractinia symbiolongicarpus]